MKGIRSKIIVTNLILLSSLQTYALDKITKFDTARGCMACHQAIRILPPKASIKKPTRTPHKKIKQVINYTF